MSQLKNYGKIDKKSWRKRLGGLVLVIIGMYLIVVMSRDLWELWRSKDRVGEAREKVSELEKERVKLEEQLKIVESEGFVEEQIRDELMLAKEGETVVVLPQGEQMNEEEQVVEEKREELANWQKWVKLFL